MSFLAKLFINGRVINLLGTNIQFYQKIILLVSRPLRCPWAVYSTSQLRPTAPPIYWRMPFRQI